MKEFFLITLLAFSPVASAQETTSRVRTPIEENLFISARAAGMGGAISTIADGIESVIYNPSLMGGIHCERKNEVTVFFPQVGLAANKNAKSLNKEFSSQQASNDANLGANIVDGAVGDQQFGRSSQILGFQYNRMITLLYSDQQIAAVNHGVPDEETEGTIDINTRTKSGFLFAGAMSSQKGDFHLGMSISYNKISEMVATNASYQQLVTSSDRKSLQTDSSYKSSGLEIGLGMTWLFEKKFNSSLSIVSNHLGDSQYTYSAAPNEIELNEKTKTYEEKQDLTIGFSVSPQISAGHYFTYIFETYRLLEKELPGKKLFRTGIELALKGFGSEAMFALRAGYFHAGASYGLSINTGLVSFDYSSQAVDIGLGNQKETERRDAFVLSLNISPK